MIQLISAINAIKAHADQTIDIAFAQQWVAKYEWLDDKYPCPSLDYTDETIREFLIVYIFFREYCEWAGMNGQCKDAMAEYRALTEANPAKDNPALKQWEIKYGELHGEIYFPVFKSEDVNHVRNIYGTTYVLPMEPVHFVALFDETFKKLYYVDLVYPEKLARQKAEYAEWLAERTAGIPKTDHPELLCKECTDYGFCQKNTPEYVPPPYAYNFKCRFDSL